MRVAGIRELRAQSEAILRGGEPVIVTRHGKISGVYLPLDDPERLPDDLRRELASVLGHHLARLLESEGIAEREVAKNFDEYRRARR